MIVIDWEAVEAFKATDEYRALGVIERERALYAAFPAVEARERALTARDIESVVWDLSVPATPDPDQTTESE